MIYEYALDPKVILKWLESENTATWLESLNGVGIGTPRFFSTFPSQKKRKFISGLAKLRYEISDQNIISRLDRLCEYLDKAGMFIRASENFSGDEWHEKVIQSHNISPFKAIVTSNKLEVLEWLPPENVVYSQLWNLPSQISFSRTTKDFLEKISNFINSTEKNLIIVDAYSWKENAITVIGKILNQFGNSPSLPSVKIYYKENRENCSPSVDHIKRQLIRVLKNNAKHLNITIYQIKETDQSDAFHNRYILNDLGGVHIGHGLDLSEKENHTDEVTLLNREIYMKRWKQFYYPDQFEILDKSE